MSTNRPGRTTHKVAGRLLRGMAIAVCHTVDRHAPAEALRSNGLFVYGRCRFCDMIIVRNRRSSWRAAPLVDDEYLQEMRAVSEVI